MNIFINAGHREGGGYESKLNMKIRDELKKILPQAIYVADDLDLKNTLDWIKEYPTVSNKFAIGIHVNANSDKTVRGAESYYADDPKYAEVFSRCVAREMGILNGGAKHDSITYVGSLGFLRQLDCPSVIVECGYSTNMMDMIAFENDGVKKAAQGIKNAIDELFPEDDEIEIIEEQLSLIQRFVAKIAELIQLLINSKKYA